MKKNILIWGTAIVLLGFAIFITNNRSLSEPEIHLSSPIEQSEDSGSSVPIDQTSTTSLLSSMEPAIDFTLSDLDGERVTLQDLQGKNVYINFWATWCKWCVKEMPDMEIVSQHYQDRDVIILAIDVGESQDKVDKYLQDKDYSFRILLDPDKSVARAYGVKSIPASVFVDTGGNVAYKRIGVMNEEQMRSVLDQLTDAGK